MKINIKNSDIDEWITDGDAEYHIGKNFKIESEREYAWNIYKKTGLSWYIGTLHMDRITIQSKGGKMVSVMVKKEGIQKEVYQCWMGIGLIKDKKALIGVVRGCIRMNQI
jgi:hypothetical protein